MSIAAAIAALRAGRPVLVADDASRENEVDVILAAELATAETVGWLVRHTSGYLCAPMPVERAEALDLPMMVAQSQDARGTAYTVSVDAAQGVTTGISAADRAQTLRVLADPQSGPNDLIRPGHVLPLRANQGGLAQRRGHTEAAVRLCELAGLTPVAAIAELVNDVGSVMRLGQAEELAKEEGLVLLTIDDLSSSAMPDVESGRHLAARVRQVGDPVRLPTAHGDFQMYCFADAVTGATHVALVSARGLADVPPVRVHSECFTGDVLASERCDCGAQLRAGLYVAAQQGGMVIHLGGQEGRGIGLAAKLAAYGLQDAGRDTVQANTELGHPADAREYGAAADILAEFGVQRLRLLTNNPDKIVAIQRAGFEVISERLEVPPGPESAAYLATKRDRMGHHLLGHYSANVRRIDTKEVVR